MTICKLKMNTWMPYFQTRIRDEPYFLQDFSNKINTGFTYQLIVRSLVIQEDDPCHIAEITLFSDRICFLNSSWNPTRTMNYRKLTVKMIDFSSHAISG